MKVLKSSGTKWGPGERQPSPTVGPGFLSYQLDARFHLDYDRKPGLAVARAGLGCLPRLYINIQ